jgi:hypothetical protein
MEDLQFQTAEFAAKDTGPLCLLCRAAVGATFYQLNGEKICDSCAGRKQFELTPVRGRTFWKAVLYGLGAAAAGSAIYAIVLLVTGAEFALLSILVGMMVGKAMMRATGGRSRRKLQIVAVLLTYGSITTGYLPTVAKEVAKVQESKAAAKKTAAPATPVTSGRPAGIVRAIIVVLVLIAFVIFWSLISPVLILTNGFSGLLGIAIIFFGLQQAWQKTKPDSSVLTGPFTAPAEVPATA